MMADLLALIFLALCYIISPVLFWAVVLGFASLIALALFLKGVGKAYRALFAEEQPRAAPGRPA